MTSALRTPRALAALLALLAVVTLTLTLPGAAPARGAPDEGAATQYTNPITSDFADTYADPAIIRGKDGYWYLYATSDPLVDGGQFGLMHMARSTDMVSWEYLGTVFDETDRPAWVSETAFFWAPDIRYVDGRYVLYYTVTDTVLNAGDDSAIGAATAPTPAGPWTPTEGPVVAPRPDGGGGFYWTFDPAMLLDDDGTRYLYFGSYHGGLWVTELDETGLHAAGEPTQVAVADKFEGSFVVERDGYYYLMASSANCCAGPSTGYSVFAGRSPSPLGPFVDHEGVPLLDERPGGTQVLVQNGNRWIGAGHHTIVTDLAGQDWLLYHAIDREQPWLDEPGGINRRPTLMDRLDWIDGWPVTRAGAGPSDEPQPAPVTGTLLGLTMPDPAASPGLRTVVGTFTPATDTDGDAGRIGVLDGTVRTARPAPVDARVEIDVRTDGGALEVRLGAAGRNAVTVTVTPDSLRASWRQGGKTDVAEAPVHDDLTEWAALSVHAADGQVTARLSESRLGDVIAEVELAVPPGALKPRPVELAGRADLDNVSVEEVSEPVTDRAPEPRAGELLTAEEFDGQLTDGWTWVRGDPGTQVAEGELYWPLDSTDLVGPGGTGALLLRHPPEGEWVAETKLELDLGEAEVRNFQQAGMVVYLDDDNFLRLGHVAIWGTRQAEFGKEVRQDGFLSWGGHTSGPVAETMWLRIGHTTNAAGEHLYRSGLSVDGETWRWGATWTLPAGTDPMVGLYTAGGAAPPTVARFDYLRFHDHT